jgi:AGCS family alanine or glycine:cation symporter
MELIARYNGIINGFIWGPVMLCFFVGTGAYMTFALGFPQIRYFLLVWKEVFKRTPREEKNKSISSFAAMATAMAATVGTGNIAGVATALHLGGPGALIWMLASAFFGMCTKFSEIVLAVNFRKKDEHGDWRGGTMYVLEHGAGHKWLAVLFALFTVFASLGTGAAVQANSAAEGLKIGFNVPGLYSGIALAFLTGLVIIGGIKSLSTVTTYIVPFMAVFYIVGSLVVIALNISEVPAAMMLAFKYAISDPMAMPGAIAGWSVKQAVSKGIARGVFSNEAGLGSAPMVHAAANVDHPVNQGLYGLFEVFVVTVIICSMTTLVILCTGTLTDCPDLTGAKLSLVAFEKGLGPVGKYVLSVGLSLFAFTTVLGWYWYAETAATDLLGIWFKPVMKVIWMALIIIGASGGDLFGTDGNEFLSVIWDVSDTLNGLMAIPNLIGLLLLSGVVRRLVKDFDQRRRGQGISGDKITADYSGSSS